MKFPIRFPFAILAVLIGFVGCVLCLIPYSSFPEKAIESYVSAINSGRAERVLNCTLDGSSTDLPEEFTAKSKMNSLTVSQLPVPDDAAEIQSVKLIGCTDSFEFENEESGGCYINALFEISYKNSDGATLKTMSARTLLLARSGLFYKIAAM